MHITYGVDMDQKTHPRYHQTHDDREGINPETDGNGKFPRGNPAIDVLFKKTRRRRQVQKLEKEDQGNDKRKKDRKTGHPGDKSLFGPFPHSTVQKETQGGE